MKNKKPTPPLYYFIFILVIFLWCITLGIMSGIKPETAGQYGDMFGAVNALFTGLAFAGLIITVLIQKDELSLQREELSDTREVLKDQKDQLEAQAKQMAQQNFESTFFSMLKLLNDNIESCQIKWKGNEYNGRDSFNAMYESFKHLWNNRTKNKDKSVKVDLRIVQEAYKALHDSNSRHLDHFYTSIKYLLMFVDANCEGDKLFYTRLVKAQLSIDLQTILFYFVLSDVDSGSLKKYLLKYRFPLDMPKYQLLHEEHENLLGEYFGYSTDSPPGIIPVP